MHNSNMIRINRSPEGADGNGGPAGDNLPAGGSGDGAPADAAPEYLSKSDFDSFRNDLTNQLSRLTPREQAREAAKDGQPGEPSKPDVSKYDFKQAGELDRYNRDNYKYHRHLDRAEEAKENETKSAAEKSKNDLRSHQGRVAEYSKENSSFASDMKAAAGKINVTDPVAKAVYGSRNGHLAVHYMAKNPGADQELNMLADSDGPDAVRERIGEMAAEMRAEAKNLEANTVAAGQKPPRFNTRGAATGGNRKATAAERFARHTS